MSSSSESDSNLENLPSEARQYHIAGHPLKCGHCANDRFLTRRSLLTTRGMTFLELEWLNDAAENYICSRCGHLMWFYDLGNGASRATEATECLACHATIPASETTCPECGWTYDAATP